MQQKLSGKKGENIIVCQQLFKTIEEMEEKYLNILEDVCNIESPMAYKIIRLEKWRVLTDLPVIVGVIQGGTTANTVAESCSFYADIRFLTVEELEKAKKEALTVANTTTVEGCSCMLKEVSYRPSMVLSDKNVELLEKMNKIYKENRPPVLNSRICLSDSGAAYITERGIPCVDNLGTEGGNIHSVDEYIRLASLAESAKRIAALIYCI